MTLFFSSSIVVAALMAVASLLGLTVEGERQRPRHIELAGQ